MYYNRSDLFNDKQISNSNQSILDHQLNQSTLEMSTKHDTLPEVQPPRDQNSVVTYTISCPPEWQLNLNRMVNCFVLFKNINTMPNSNGIQLKCSVCKTMFHNIGDLTRHKENNALCINNIEIDGIKDSSINKKKYNKKKGPTKLNTRNLNFATNFYEDEDQEKDEEVSMKNADNSLNSNNESFINELEQSECSADEFIDDDTLHMRLFDEALKNSKGFKKKIQNNSSFRGNKLLTELTYSNSDVIGQSETIRSLNQEYATRYLIAYLIDYREHH